MSHHPSRRGLLALGPGLAATVEWYRENEGWWRPQKAGVETQYSAAEKVI